MQRANLRQRPQGLHYSRRDSRGGGISFNHEHYRFLKRLSGDKKKKFKKLLQLGILGAKMAERYYCLGNGQKLITLRELAPQFGLSENCPSHVCDHIHAVLRVLNPRFVVSKKATEIATAITRTLERLERRKIEKRQNEKKKRRQEVQERKQKRWARKILSGTGMKSLPEGITPEFLPQFELVCRSIKEGTLDLLSDEEREAIELRFGVKDGQFRTQEEVAFSLQRTTRAWGSQILNSALSILSQ